MNKMFYFVIALFAYSIGMLTAIWLTPTEEPHPLRTFHYIGIAIILTTQIYYGFVYIRQHCAECGHRRHMHDKKSLVSGGYESLCRIVCDNFVNDHGIRIKENYIHKYGSPVGWR